MIEYHRLLRDVQRCGQVRPDRTGTGVIGVFGRQIRFDLAAGFPLLTTRAIHYKSIIHELIWFLKGDTNIQYLNDNGVTIWDEWADESGDLGPIYGHQWRSWETRDGNTIDQIEELIRGLKQDPFGRRHIVSAWNVAEIDEMALPPCHCLFQFYVSVNREGQQVLSCQLYQRSADIFLGVPFNIASYAMLTHIIANICGMQVGEFVHTFGDLHLYSNHQDQANTLLSREPRRLPNLVIGTSLKTIDDLSYNDILIENYNPRNPIKAQIAV